MSMQTREQMLFDLERKAYLDLIAQARAEGERAGIERAAKWHEDQYMRLREENYELVRKFGLPDHVRLDESYRHRRYADAIRALKVEGE